MIFQKFLRAVHLDSDPLHPRQDHYLKRILKIFSISHITRRCRSVRFGLRLNSLRKRAKHIKTILISFPNQPYLINLTYLGGSLLSRTTRELKFDTDTNKTNQTSLISLNLFTLLIQSNLIGLVTSKRAKELKFVTYQTILIKITESTNLISLT